MRYIVTLVSHVIPVVEPVQYSLLFVQPVLTGISSKDINVLEPIYSNLSIKSTSSINSLFYKHNHKGL